MSPERKAYLAKRRRQDKVDRLHAETVKALEIFENPIDLPSLERGIAGEPYRFLSDGYVGQDKPHRVMYDAMAEIRALRAYIHDNLPF